MRVVCVDLRLPLDAVTKLVFIGELVEETKVNYPLNGIELKDAPGYFVDCMEMNERGG